MLRIQTAKILFLILTLAAINYAQTTAFNYQGKLSDAGNPANGNYQMQFALFDALANGNQVGATVSISDVAVSQGIFAVPLDFGAGAFPGADRFLEISVRRNANENYVTLSPREQINTTPQAIRSRSAETADNAVQLGGVAASEYPTTQSISNTFINNGNNSPSNLGGAPQDASFNISGDGIIGGSLAVGTAAPEAGVKLDVTGNSVFRTANGDIKVGTPNGETGITFNGTNRADLRFDGTFFRLAAGNGLSVPAQQGFVLSTTGNAALGTLPNPNYRFDIFGGVRSFDNVSNQFVVQTTGGTNAWARFYMRTPNRSWFIGSSQNFVGDQFYLFDETSNQSRMTVQPNGGAISFPFGDVGIGVTPQAGIKLDVSGVGRFITPNGVINLGTPNTETGMSIIGTNRADVRFNGATLTLAAGNGIGVPANTGISVTTSGNVGIGTVNPTTKFEVVGTTKTGVLQITGGSDLAENFETADDVKPGMIVAIDTANHGRLILARGAYNRRVAGVVSGANNLSAGMILPNLNPDEKGLPVALSGRVWVYADATKNPIKAGDLLTTSEREGYAMKVTKHKKANGAIIGKAMTELEKGTGLVLVLVTLQ